MQNLVAKVNVRRSHYGSDDGVVWCSVTRRRRCLPAWGSHLTVSRQHRSTWCRGQGRLGLASWRGSRGRHRAAGQRASSARRRQPRHVSRSPSVTASSYRPSDSSTIWLSATTCFTFVNPSTRLLLPGQRRVAICCNFYVAFICFMLRMFAFHICMCCFKPKFHYTTTCRRLPRLLCRRPKAQLPLEEVSDLLRASLRVSFPNFITTTRRDTIC